MELLEGETLHQRLAKGPIQVSEWIDTALALSDALDMAHRAGIIHRDIEPANIFLTARGPKILDFGLVKDITLAETGSSRTPTMVQRDSPIGA
jgi:serine/threonine protein kinase